MKHETVVPYGPRGTTRNLVANESILGRQNVVSEFLLVEQVTKLVFEIRVFVVADLKHAILHAKSIRIVLAKRVPSDLGNPSIEIPAIEKLYPLFGVRACLSQARHRDDGCKQTRGEFHGAYITPEPNKSRPSASMDGMIRRALLTCVLLTAATGLFAQSDEAEARRREAAAEALREQQRRAEAESLRRQREEANERMREFLRDTSADIRKAAERSEQLREAERKQRAEKFRETLEEFAVATDDFREAMALQKSLKPPAGKLEKYVGTFLDLMKEMTDRPAKLDSSEFKDIKNKLVWEALTTAERMLPQLQTVISIEGDKVVDVRFLDSLSSLQNDLLRLQWMTRRLK